jgi:disulfide oxidoreductase YuzD
MLSVNKKFNDPIFFEKLLKRNYPEWIFLKSNDENWRKFYVKMVYYLSKIEESGINLPKSWDPKRFYDFISEKNKDKYNDTDFEKDYDNFEEEKLEEGKYFLENAIKEGKLNIYKNLLR